MTHSAPLTMKSVGKTLILLAVPTIAGMIGMVIFNLVDTYYVGLPGVDELAAMDFTIPVVMFQGFRMFCTVMVIVLMGYGFWGIVRINAAVFNAIKNRFIPSRSMHLELSGCTSRLLLCFHLNSNLTEFLPQG